MEEIGPVDLAIIAFPGNRFRGEIAPALADLVDAGTIRIVDIAFVGKNAEGDAVAFELTELDPDVQEGLERAGIEVQGLLNEDDLTIGFDDASRLQVAALEPLSRRMAQLLAVHDGTAPIELCTDFVDGDARTAFDTSTS